MICRNIGSEVLPGCDREDGRGDNRRLMARSRRASTKTKLANLSYHLLSQVLGHFSLAHTIVNTTYLARITGPFRSQSCLRNTVQVQAAVRAHDTIPMCCY